MKQEPQTSALQRMDQDRLFLSAPPDRFSTATALRAQLHRCASALRKRWWVLLLTFVLVSAPAIYYAAVHPPTYHSEAILWLASKLTLPGGDRLFSEDASYIGTQAELIKSPAVQSRAFEKVRNRFPEIAGGQTGNPPVRLPFDLSVTTSPKHSVLELEAKGAAPAATRAFLDAVMEEYFAVKKDSRRRSSSGALSSITDQIKDVEAQIQRQQAELTTFETSNNISYLTEHGLSAGSHLAKIVEMLSDLRTECRLLELLTPAELMGMVGISEVPLAANSSAVVPGEKSARAVALATSVPQSAYYQVLQQIQILKAKRNEFAQVLRPTHSKMLKLSQELTSLEQLLKTLKEEGEQQALAQMVNRKKSLELQIENLESQHRAWETNAAQASRKLADFDRMKQDLQRSQALYDRLLGLLQTVDLNNNIDQEPLTALGPASSPRPTLTKYKIAAAGVFLAFVAALGLLALLEVLDDRFTSVNELRLVLPAEVIGQVPESRLGSCNGTPPLLPAANLPAFAEAFRNLRSSLLFMASEQTPHPRVVLISSAVSKEGKTTVAANLASTLAMSGARVLLVDADFRRGSVHRLFGLTRKPGLQEVLSEAISPDEAVVSTSQPNLFVMPAGDSVGGSSDLLLRRRMDQLLRDLAAKYDYVFVDTAPVLATDEAASLGPMTDGVYLVVRAGYTSSRVAREAANRLQLCNVKILGIIYNRADPSTDYYSRYTREYHNGSGVKMNLS